MPMRRFTPAVAVLGLLLVAAPAAAQTPIDESLSKRDAHRLDQMEKALKEVRDIVFRGRDTGKPVVVQSADAEAQLGEVASRLTDIEQSLTRINGSIETVSHELDLARRDNAALSAQVKALTERLSAAEQKLAAAQVSPPAAATPAEAAAAPPAEGDPTRAFAEARRLMLSGEYDRAEEAFRDFVQTYPDAPRTPEARYWWGKTLSVKGAHAEAATAFIGAIRGSPQTAWGPDAMVELARELVALKKPTDACQVLAELGRSYPKAAPAVKARAAAIAAQAKCG